MFQFSGDSLSVPLDTKTPKRAAAASEMVSAVAAVPDAYNGC